MERDSLSISLYSVPGRSKKNMSFVEFKTTRAKKPAEELEAGKTWQVNARRLYIPLDGKEYGLAVKEWEEGGKKHHAITWKQKPYAKLLLNSDAKAKAILQLQVNTTGGLAIQVDPADFGKFYVSVPKGALANLPKVSAMLGVKVAGKAFTYSKN